jgi:hypothetical protein
MSNQPPLRTYESLRGEPANEKKPVPECYNAIDMDGKHACPICKQVAIRPGGFIRHGFLCKNASKEYCQRSQFGGRRRATRKNYRKTRKSSRRAQRR